MKAFVPVLSAVLFAAANVAGDNSLSLDGDLVERACMGNDVHMRLAQVEEACRKLPPGEMEEAMADAFERSREESGSSSSASASSGSSTSEEEEESRKGKGKRRYGDGKSKRKLSEDEPFNFVEFIEGFTSESVCVFNTLGLLDDDLEVNTTVVENFLAATRLSTIFDDGAVERTLDYAARQVEDVTLASFLAPLACDCAPGLVCLPEQEEGAGPVFFDPEEEFAALDNNEKRLVADLVEGVTFVRGVKTVFDTACKRVIESKLERMAA